MNAPKSNPREAYKTTVSRVSQLKHFVDKELGVSEWISLSQDRIDAFAEVTEDQQWIHVDPERAKRDSPYGTTIAHGFLVLSMVPKVCYETLHIENAGMGINYGLDRIRFASAVPSGGEIRGRVKLDAFREIAGGARLNLRITIEAKGQKKPACVAELISQVFVKP